MTPAENALVHCLIEEVNLYRAHADGQDVSPLQKLQAASNTDAAREMVEIERKNAKSNPEHLSGG